ncbi:MAG: GNAT family N-acetyltransferase [Haloechinothrix sp.]
MSIRGAVGEIETAYVIPEARGAGVSTALAQAAVAYLRDRGARTIRLLVCAEDDRARRFWQKQGFTPDMVALSRYE